MSQSGSERSLAISYVGLRRGIGIIGFFLPLVLAVGKIAIEGPGIEGSISSYYYTVMRNVFVGSLCAIGVFLFSYRFRKHDIVAAILAGIFAVVVALFPATPEGSPTPAQKVIGTVHLASAALFFLTLAYFSLFLFTKTSPEATRKPSRPLDYLSLLVVTRTVAGVPLGRRKKWRNLVYRVCGYTILACMALMGLNNVASVGGLVEHLHPVFWLESIAVMAFGFSWLVKGETLLRDRKSGVATAVQAKT